MQIELVFFFLHSTLSFGNSPKDLPHRENYEIDMVESHTVKKSKML